MKHFDFFFRAKEKALHSAPFAWPLHSLDAASGLQWTNASSAHWQLAGKTLQSTFLSLNDQWLKSVYAKRLLQIKLVSSFKWILYSHPATGECVQSDQCGHTPFPGHSLLQYLARYALQLKTDTSFSGNPTHALLLCHSSLPGLLLFQSSGNSSPPGGDLCKHRPQIFEEGAPPA